MKGRRHAAAIRHCVAGGHDLRRQSANRALAAEGRTAHAVADRRNRATDVRRIGASNRWVNGRPEGGYAWVDFEGFWGAGLVLPGNCLGARYDCPSRTRQ